MAAMHFLKIIINGADQSSVSPPSGQDTKPHQSSDGQRDRGAAEAPRGRVNSPHTCCTNNHNLFNYFLGRCHCCLIYHSSHFCSRVSSFTFSPPTPPEILPVALPLSRSTGSTNKSPGQKGDSLIETSESRWKWCHPTTSPTSQPSFPPAD